MITGRSVSVDQYRSISTGRSVPVDQYRSSTGRSVPVDLPVSYFLRTVQHTPTRSGRHTPERATIGVTTADDRTKGGSDDYFPDDADRRPGEPVWFDEPNEVTDAVEQEGVDLRRQVPGDDATVVIEDGVIGKRLRRPMDLVRLLVAVFAMAAIAAIAFATSTTTGLGTDLTEASRRRPIRLCWSAKRHRRLGTADLARGCGCGHAGPGPRPPTPGCPVGPLPPQSPCSPGVSLLIEHFGSACWQFALADPSTLRTLLLPLLGGLVAFITVARLMARGALEHPRRHSGRLPCSWSR